jgi:chloramphenicol 3-O phosphotransferase
LTGQNKVTPGRIVVLNGTSSSGKTSILLALQNILMDPYLDCGIDKFIWMLPKRYLDRPLWDDVLGKADHAGSAGQSLFSGMHHAIAALSRCGCNVLADHVFVDPSWKRECAHLFVGLPAYLVGIRCPLAVLEERERSRRNRTLGQAALQYPLVHHGLPYDCEVDTSVLSIQECADVIKKRLESSVPPSAFKTISADLLLDHTHPRS